MRFQNGQTVYEISAKSYFNGLNKMTVHLYVLLFMITADFRQAILTQY